MIKRNFAVLLVAALVLGGGALALAQGPPERPSPDQGRRHAARHGGGFLGRAVHGDLIVRRGDGRFESVSFDRGTVHPDSDGSKVVVDRPDGKQVSLQLTAETRYRGVTGAAQLREGRPAKVASRDGKALVVAQRDRAEEGPTAGNKDGPPAVPKD